MGPSRPVSVLDVLGRPDNLTIVHHQDFVHTEDAARTQLDVIVVVLVFLVTALVVMLVCKLMQNRRSVAVLSGRKDNYYSEEHNQRMLILYSSVKLDHSYANALVKQEILP